MEVMICQSQMSPEKFMIFTHFCICQYDKYNSKMLYSVWKLLFFSLIGPLKL